MVVRLETANTEIASLEEITVNNLGVEKKEQQIGMYCIALTPAQHYTLKIFKHHSDAPPYCKNNPF